MAQPPIFAPDNKDNSIAPHKTRVLSPTVRYLIGYGAHGPVRG